MIKDMNNMKVKQSVVYNGKRYTLPFLVAKESLSTEEDTVKNRFGGESCTLPAFAIAVYDVIIGSEMLGDYKTVRRGLDWFSRNFTKQYMVLLD
jgi:hypothetical protein